MSTTATGTPRISADRVWHEIAKASFCVLGHVTPAGEPRSSGVMYTAVGKRLYVVVSPDSWKVRHLATGDPVAITVPVRRGGLLSLLFPIPPAAISLHARVTVHPAGSLDIASVAPKFARMLPGGGRDSCVLELAPEGTLLTYGIGVSLRQMQDPASAQARVEIG